MARKLLGDLMPAECTEQDRNIFLPRPRFRASGGVGDLDNGANRESRLQRVFANQSVPVYRKGSVGVCFGMMMASC